MNLYFWFFSLSGCFYVHRSIMILTRAKISVIFWWYTFFEKKVWDLDGKTDSCVFGEKWIATSRKFSFNSAFWKSRVVVIWGQNVSADMLSKSTFSDLEKTRSAKKSGHTKFGRNYHLFSCVVELFNNFRNFNFSRLFNKIGQNSQFCNEYSEKIISLFCVGK